MAVNKVVYNGETLVDLTNDSVTPETLAEGVTAHDASGAVIIGTMETGGGGGGSDLASILFSEKTFVEHTITDIPADGFRGWQFVQKIDMPKVTSMGNYTCYNCTGLTAIDFPLCETIGNYAFYNNTDVVSINMPNLKTTGTNAFRQLTSLASVVLPSLTAINGTVFQKCTMLAKADFPLAKSVGANAFNGCSVLTALILRNSTLCTLANVSALNATPIKSGSGYVYVPSALVDTYKSASNWSTFAAQFRAIEDYPEITGG